uniref:BPTI/Kunitz inhibitor domain-containing protein n=1 Tax=Echinococcus canadensis TaxID=519352 RepID=A0A915EXC1_9CEST
VNLMQLGWLLGRADICNLKIERGTCQSHIKVYGYNRKKGHCEHFIYSGCGGNANRFNDRSECKRVCANAIDSGCDSGKEDVCNLPMRTGPCRAYFRVWGYNLASDQCESFVYGGCGGNANQFKEKIECERACASGSRGNCSQAMKEGICRVYVESWGYDPAKGRGVRFNHGSCRGNENRFIS